MNHLDLAKNLRYLFKLFWRFSIHLWIIWTEFFRLRAYDLYIKALNCRLWLKRQNEGKVQYLFSTELHLYWHNAHSGVFTPLSSFAILTFSLNYQIPKIVTIPWNDSYVVFLLVERLICRASIGDNQAQLN